MYRKKASVPYYYLVYIILVLSSWTYYMSTHHLFHLLNDHVSAILTMILGSFIAGSSPEGSASVAYPVFTLYLGIIPSVARNFAFAIQSIGMTAASILILNRKIKIDLNYIKYVTSGGLVGLILGTYFVVPYISAVITKLLFVSLWLGFGMVLFYENQIKKRTVSQAIQIRHSGDYLILSLLGLAGGILSSMFGAGINILSFCFVVIYYNLNEKVATPSSIIIMAVESIAGFALHALWLRDMTPDTFDMWLSCIPFVIFFAPLGAYVLDRTSRKTYNNFLYLIFGIQYIGALIVIRPGLAQSVFSAGIIVGSIILFRWIEKIKPSTSDVSE